MGVVHAAGIGRQEAAAMRDADLQLRMRVEHAPEDEVADGHGRIERIADHVAEIVLREPAAIGEAVGVQEDQDTEFFGLGEDRPEPLLGKIGAGDVGAELDAAQAERLHRALQLRHRKFGGLHRHRAEADESVGVPGDRCGNVVVDQARRVAAELGRRPVEILRRSGGDRLDVDAHAVHVGDATLDRGEHRTHGFGLGLLDRARGLVGETAHRLVWRDARGRHQRSRLGRDDMAMNVDDRTRRLSCAPLRCGGLTVWLRCAGVEHDGDPPVLRQR